MSTVTASDWINGIALSILASVIGGASKLSIRKSWLMENGSDSSRHETTDEDSNSGTTPGGLISSRDIRRRSSQSLEEGNNEPNSSEEGFNDEGPSEEGVTENSENNDSDDGDLVNNLLPRRRKWWALALRGSGMIGMTFLNPLCCVLAMQYASPSILAPFSGLTLVWIVLFSQPLIGESPSYNQVMAASLIVFGQVLIALFGDHTNDEGMTVQDVRDSYVYLPFVMYLIGLGTWMLLLVYLMRYGTNAVLKRFAWGVAGGSVTGLQNFLKDTLTIVKASPSTFPWFFYVFVALAAGSAFGGLLFLTACMKLYDATYSSAMFVGSFVVSASIMSAAHYSTFSHLTTVWNWTFYPLGVTTLMGGVWLLVHEQRHGDTAESRQSVRRNGPVEMVRMLEK